MRKGIHPKLHMNAKVTDLSTGTSFTLPSTKEEIVTEVTNLSHPFYTGKHRIVDTENLVKKFEKRRETSNVAKVTSKKLKQSRRRNKTTSINTNNTLTLKDMLSKVK